jgi:uncharacterized protein (TIGR00730 family)
METVVTIFGSSRPQEGEPEFTLAYDTGYALGRAGFTICNGGYGGIMMASARGAKEAGAKTIGVTASVFDRQANPWIDREITVPTLIDRLMKLIELGDSYVVFKGGTGTLLEFSCVWELINKGMMKQKPIVVVGDFWNNVIETLRGELLWEGMGDCTKFITRVGTAEECTRLLMERFDRRSGSPGAEPPSSAPPNDPS